MPENQKKSTMAALKSSKSGGIIEWIRYLQSRNRFDDDPPLELPGEGVWQDQMSSPMSSKPKWSLEALRCSTAAPAVKAKVLGSGTAPIWEKAFDFVPTLKEVVNAILEEYDEELI